jgi:hypothetical protein
MGVQTPAGATLSTESTMSVSRRDWTWRAVLVRLASRRSVERRSTPASAESAPAGPLDDRPQSGPKPPIFSPAETTRYDKFVVALDDLMEQHEEDAPDGLAGRPDFREFRFKGVANELVAGIKRKIDGRSV